MSHPAQPSDPPRQRIALASGPAAYTDEGPATEAPVVLMVHGLPGSGRDFRWLAPTLTDRARVIRVDLPGFGETPADGGRRTALDPVAQADYVAAFHEALALPPCLVIGHSMGGVYATELARRHPERVTALGLVSSPGLEPHRGLRSFRAPMLSRVTATGPMRWLMRRPLRRGFAAAGFSRHFTDDERQRTVDMVARVQIERHAANVFATRVPTGVFWCADDPLIEDRISQRLADAAPEGPRQRHLDGGHNPQKAHADEIGDALFALCAPPEVEPGGDCALEAEL